MRICNVSQLFADVMLRDSKPAMTAFSLKPRDWRSIATPPHAMHAPDENLAPARSWPAPVRHRLLTPVDRRLLVPVQHLTKHGAIEANCRTTGHAAHENTRDRAVSA
jgi:hypothetical protein